MIKRSTIYFTSETTEDQSHLSDLSEVTCVISGKIGTGIACPSSTGTAGTSHLTFLIYFSFQHVGDAPRINQVVSGLPSAADR